MRGLRRALAVLWLGALVSAPAQGQHFGQNQVQYRRHAWRTLRSGHFTVVSDRDLDSLALRVLDLAERTHASLSARLGHELSRRVPIVLYGAPDDYAQTNVLPGPTDPDGAGPTEMFRDRIVLPFTGSYGELRHALAHELVHAWLFDMTYGGSAVRMLARGSFYALPEWFSEGLAEYLARGMDPEAEMVLRDGSVEGYLPPLARAGGGLAYREGQSAVAYLVERHGEDALRTLLRDIRRMGFERAFRRAVGMKVSMFDEQWRAWARRRYWPTVAARREPEAFARRLTDHRRDGSLLNTAPAVSPRGDRVAWFSDRSQYTDVCVMPATDGRSRRRLVRGARGVSFESRPSFRSSLTWSPDGRRLALVAPRGGRDAILVVSAESGRVLRSVKLACDALAYPAWSPTGDTLVVSELREGRSDLWLVDLGTGGARRLTDDAWDEKEPCWRPDGRAVTFASDRPAPGRPEAGRRPGSYRLFDLDVASGVVTPLLDTAGDDHSPAWSPDGRRLAFVSDRGGAPDVHLYETASGSCVRLTRLIGGAGSLSWSRADDRLVFSAFNRGGYDVFALREPVSVDAVLARLLQSGAADSVACADSASAVHGGLAGADTTAGWLAGATAGGSDGAGAPRDSVAPRPSHAYHVGLAPDLVGFGVTGGVGYGFFGTTSVVLGDLLGDHRVVVSADPVGGPLREANALARYLYLARRADLDLAVFHFRDYHAAGPVATAEQLESPRLFAGRAFGATAGATFPLDRSLRLGVSLTRLAVEHALAGARASVSGAALSLTGDDALWGPTGPANGARFDLTFTPAFAWGGDALVYRTTVLDARRYWSLARGYTLAGRVLAARSDGRDAPPLRVGGFSTLRGFDAYSIAGTRLALASAEVRFPFIQQLGVLGPLPLGAFSLRGALFGDAGLAWDAGVSPRLSAVVNGRRRLVSPRVGFGAGLRTAVPFAVVKLDAAWNTTLAHVSGVHWHFSAGPEF